LPFFYCRLRFSIAASVAAQPANLPVSFTWAQHGTNPELATRLLVGLASVGVGG
jgi:predicted component of type VI protein secretion system